MTVLNHPGGVMVNILASSVVDCRFGPPVGSDKKKEKKEKAFATSLPSMQ